MTKVPFNPQTTAMSLAETYPRFAAVMDEYGYAWDDIKVHTEDQYILTTFHILGKSGAEPPTDSKGSVLCQHGDSQDGASWLANF